MSRLPARPRGDGYTNGFRNAADHYGQSDDSTGNPYQMNGDSRTRERRAGGYGGFGDVQPEQTQQYEDAHVMRPTSLERRTANRRSGESSRWSGSRSRSRPGGGRYGSGSQQIEDVLQNIQQSMGFMTDSSCVPVQVALQLLDSSSLGLASRYDEFRETQRQLQSALKAIVNEHHQGFNSSIGTFHTIQASIQTSQARVHALKASLVTAKSNLSRTRPELRTLATTSQNYDDMLQLLATIEQLQGVPEKLEARISEKRFLSAVDILQDALRIIRMSEMENIGALSDLRVYLSNQEHSLTDILIEEMHSHLYLKSPYCEDRWKAFIRNPGGNSNYSSGNDARVRQMYMFLDQLDIESAMTEDTIRNPEADTFRYLQLILEALNKMGRLEDAIDSIEQRLPVELFKVVDRANVEVVQRHPNYAGATGKDRRNNIKPKTDEDDRSAVLNDLLRNLYPRFEAIAEGHRVVHDVVAGIAKRDGLGGVATLTRGFRELWKLYQSEMRSLLHDYLASDADIGSRSGQTSAGVRNVFGKNTRDKSKRMFKLADMDKKSMELTTEKDDLEFILKSSVPGLVSATKPSEPTAEADETAYEEGATGHKLLVEPSVFNMSILLPPSLSFLNRLKEIVPPGSDIVLSTLTSFLDDFLVNVFQPQLDETLMDLCARTFIELDAFQEDPDWALHAQKPIFKGTSTFFTLISGFCKMLDSLPHDQAFSQLVISQLTTYYDKCFGWYKALSSRAQAKADTGSRLKAAAAFADSGEIKEAVLALKQAETQEWQKCLEKESNLFISAADQSPIDEIDLFENQKSVSALCLLYTSMRWLAAKVTRLRRISSHATDSTKRDSRANQHKRRWTLVTALDPHYDGTTIYLPLNQDTATAFDAVVNSYQELATTALLTLHFELRCRTVHGIRQSFSTTYELEQPVNEADANILSLNTDLISFDEDLSHYLREPEHKFIVSGLSYILDTLLVHFSPNIKSMNANGLGRMQLNILVLQQNLKNIEPQANLSRSAAYYDLFTAGPEAILAQANESKAAGRNVLGIGHQELKVMVELCFSENLTSERREVAVKAKKDMDDLLSKLSDIMEENKET